MYVLVADKSEELRGVLKSINQHEINTIIEDIDTGVRCDSMEGVGDHYR